MLNKMKKLILGLLLLPLTMFSQGSDDAQLNIILGETFEITVSDPTVTINMDLPQHFQQGNDSGILTSHLKTTATGSYTVEVETSNSQFTSTSSGVIDVSNVELTVVDNGDLSGSQPTVSNLNFQATDLALSNTSQQVLNTAGGDIERGFNVTYSIPQTNTGNFLNQAQGTYTTTVTYTITLD